MFYVLINVNLDNHLFVYRENICFPIRKNSLCNHEALRASPADRRKLVTQTIRPGLFASGPGQKMHRGPTRLAAAQQVDASCLIVFLKNENRCELN
jgi:hypothetical protein